MPVNILMPALSPTMEKGKLAKWLKKEGDKVKSGDVLAEIETDKATMEVEAVDEGTLGKILVAEGTDDVLVNAPIAIILGEGEKLGDLPKAATAPVAKPAAAPAAAAAPTASATSAPLPKADGSRIFASPLAKRIAKQKGIDLAAVKGSGPHGRVVLKDVENAKPGAVPAAKTAGMPQGMSDEAVLKLFEPGSYDLVPHDGMRKTIARRLTESKQTVPHFYVTVDCVLEHLLPLRERLNLQAPRDKDGKPAWKVSVNDFIIKAMAMALMKVPDANVSWTENAMVKHHHADVGVAVSIPGGLITPVVRKAETKGLTQISMEMKDYAARARTRRLKPEEYTGGSTSVSNLGMMNIKNFAAIVNPPQATILAVGTGERRAVVRGNDIVIEHQMSVTLSTDHRCVDGALGAELLSAFRMYLEDPGLMLV
ncbi:MAG TPA: pyruvate dehydrogenase complex dihydrolipoamide acetyltransferase [Aestuariivirga sp.]|jgi:pyruvate dehydrogenase E2 component (dihydrolipoamide acetyltransferase)|nr:pyruvate dehydrogenase complex dihydrolipoamide acetyltransferase [Hyphomicrobiales bacterium]MCC7481400.1 pyruvate dehydrogenase complex dihydrolipoamide acetyltransferase [Hyphomicrobiales bacterium]HQY75006.1 pyruvate dehydrogenase complex dihydrolipoamide acetyltransferase [Aestuariivirga sp.]HRA95168.1 pyruvate dehydrogenase complex dihydrolipoamide acetyltransferase [Aestuariivirga sp.]